MSPKLTCEKRHIILLEMQEFFIKNVLDSLFTNYIVMKNIVCFFLSCLLGESLLFSPHETVLTSEKKKVKVVLLLDDYICSEDQWCYLYGFKDWVSGNERTIFDSAFIPKGQHQIELQGEIYFATEFNVLFSRKGPNFSIPVEPDSCVIMQVEEPDGEAFYYKNAIQGKFNNDYYVHWQEKITYHNKLKDFIVAGQKDSIEFLKANRFKYLTTRLKSLKTSWKVGQEYIGLNIEFPEKKVETNMLAKLIARKFPDDLRLQESVKNRKLAPISEESKRIGKRIFELREAKSIIDTMDLSLGKQLILTFPNDKGDKISTKDSYMDYTLIDFWASWCKPCRKEVPFIKQAKQKYSDKIDVYAVSLDANREAWQKAIKEDSTEVFKQLIGTYPNGQPSRLLRELNIKAIPTNFLLDKESRIIAKDLRGEQLIYTLDSLINQ